MDPRFEEIAPTSVRALPQSAGMCRRGPVPGANPRRIAEQRVRPGKVLACVLDGPLFNSGTPRAGPASGVLPEDWAKDEGLFRVTRILIPGRPRSLASVARSGGTSATAAAGSTSPFRELERSAVPTVSVVRPFGPEHLAIGFGRFTVGDRLASPGFQPGLADTEHCGPWCGKLASPLVTASASGSWASSGPMPGCARAVLVADATMAFARRAPLRLVLPPMHASPCAEAPR